MILQTKDEILNWLKENDYEYDTNIENNSYEFIDINQNNHQYLLQELIKKDNLELNYFEKLKDQGNCYFINVKGKVNLFQRYLQEIPFQFYHVEKNFECDENQLKTLRGCPQYVGGDFICNDNKLISLEGCPEYIQGYFNCSANKIKTLTYFPKVIHDFLFIYKNNDLLEYKNKSNDIHIQNMSDDDFVRRRDFDFWYQFHMVEKIKEENLKIIDDLAITNKIEIKPKIMKV